MKEFNYSSYLKNNPLLKEYDDEEGSGYSYNYEEGPGASDEQLNRIISRFKSDKSSWEKLAKNDFYSLAQGESADIKTDYYPEWKKSDFQKVISAIDGAYTSIEEDKQNKTTKPLTTFKTEVDLKARPSTGNTEAATTIPAGSTITIIQKRFPKDPKYAQIEYNGKLWSIGAQYAIDTHFDKFYKKGNIRKPRFENGIK